MQSQQFIQKKKKTYYDEFISKDNVNYVGNLILQLYNKTNDMQERNIKWKSDVFLGQYILRT